MNQRRWNENQSTHYYHKRFRRKQRFFFFFPLKTNLNGEAKKLWWMNRIRTWIGFGQGKQSREKEKQRSEIWRYERERLRESKQRWPPKLPHKQKQKHLAGIRIDPSLRYYSSYTFAKLISTLHGFQLTHSLTLVVACVRVQFRPTYYSSHHVLSLFQLSCGSTNPTASSLALAYFSPLAP